MDFSKFDKLGRNYEVTISGSGAYQVRPDDPDSRMPTNSETGFSLGHRASESDAAWGRGYRDDRQTWRNGTGGVDLHKFFVLCAVYFWVGGLNGDLGIYFERARSG